MGQMGGGGDGQMRLSDPTKTRMNEPSINLPSTVIPWMLSRALGKHKGLFSSLLEPLHVLQEK